MQQNITIRVHKALLIDALSASSAPRDMVDILRNSPTSSGIYISSMMCIPRLTTLWLLLNRLDGIGMNSGSSHRRHESAATSHEDMQQAWQVSITTDVRHTGDLSVVQLPACWVILMPWHLAIRLMSPVDASGSACVATLL
jgi:hypothetical protein